MRCSPGRRRLPEDIVNAHNALGLGVAAVINNRSLGFYPDEASILRQHSILTAHCLTLGTHCRDREVYSGEDRERSFVTVTRLKRSSENCALQAGSRPC